MNKKFQVILRLLAKCVKRKRITVKCNIMFALLSIYILTHLLVEHSYCRSVQLSFDGSCSNEYYFPKNFDININILAEPSKCTDDTKLLIFIPITAEKVEARLVIRETWARPFVDNSNVKLVFVVAFDKLSFNSLQNEYAEHRDILWFDFREDYYNLSLKVFNVFNWIMEKCPNVTHIVRADADIVLFKHGLDNFLANHQEDEMTIFGNCRTKDCVMRNHNSNKCISRSLYPNVSYPRYCFGFSYIWTKDILEKVTSLCRKRRYFPLDDILFTGILVEESSHQIRRVNYRGLFDYKKLFNRFPCNSTQIAAASYKNLNTARQAWKRYSIDCKHPT